MFSPVLVQSLGGTTTLRMGQELDENWRIYIVKGKINLGGLYFSVNTKPTRSMGTGSWTLD